VCEVGRDFIIPFRFVFFVHKNSSAAGSSARCTFRLFSDHHHQEREKKKEKLRVVSEPAARASQFKRWRHRLNFSNGFVLLTVTGRSDPIRRDAMRYRSRLSMGDGPKELGEGI
jgi:hypothetical protein